MKKNSFHANNIEKPEFNQFWFSERTIDTIVQELTEIGAEKIAFFSTPSVFFAAQSLGLKGSLLDIDDSLACNVSEPNNFVKYDYRDFEGSVELYGTFEAAVVDPPFITPDVMRAYATHVRSVLLPEGKIIWSSTVENESILKALLGCETHPVFFRPSIPTLVYQYNIYVNYELINSSALRQPNPEVPSP